MLRDACLDQGNAASKPIDDQAYQIAHNWKPASDYYTSAAIRQGVAAIQAMLSKAFDALASANDACIKAPGCSFPTWGDRYGSLLQATTQSQSYLATADQADSEIQAAFQTAYVVAPGFKDWVLQAMGAASDAITDSAYVMCAMPWWAALAVDVVNAAAAAATVIMAIETVAADTVKAAYAAGSAVVKTAAEAFSLSLWALSHLSLIAGLAAALLGGAWVFKNRDRIKSRYRSLVTPR